MSRVKVSSRNQIVIPADVRKELGIKPGDRLLILAGDGLVSIIPNPDSNSRQRQSPYQQYWGEVDRGECIKEAPGVTSTVKVGSKNQIAVPSAVRQKLDIGPGDYLLVSIWDQCITMIPEPESYAEALRGLHKEIWEGIDVEEYINQERDAWEN